jgi:hypothetical protein
MQEAPAHAPARTGLKAAIGMFIAAFAVFGDNVIGIIIILAAATVYNPLAVWPIAVAIVAAINYACCMWVWREWPSFVSGAGAKFEKRIDGLRNSKLMRKPIAWISEGSTRRFTLAAILTNAVTAVTAAHIVGAAVDRRRIACAALGFAAVSCALHTAFGTLIGYGVRAIA